MDEQNKGLETTVGGLEEAFKFKRVLAGAELCAQGNLNGQYWTGDFFVYEIEKCPHCDEEKAYLYVVSQDNPILEDVREASKQLLNNKEVAYCPSKEIIEKAKRNAKVKINVSDLCVKAEKSERGKDTEYFVIDENNNEAQRALVEALYGPNAYACNFNLRLGETRVYTFSKDSVKTYARGGSTLIRAGLMLYKDEESYFSTYGWKTDDEYKIRGELLSPEELAVKEHQYEIKQAYKTLIASKADIPQDMLSQLASQFKPAEKVKTPEEIAAESQSSVNAAYQTVLANIEDKSAKGNGLLGKVASGLADWSVKYFQQKR